MHSKPENTLCVNKSNTVIANHEQSLIEITWKKIMKMCTCNIYVIVFVGTIKETNIHNHARQKYHGLCKKGSKGSYMCVYSQEETEAARRHANKKRRWKYRCVKVLR
jgi:hypothetical protein